METVSQTYENPDVSGVNYNEARVLTEPDPPIVGGYIDHKLADMADDDCIVKAGSP